MSLTKTEAQFLLAAVINYTGYGPPRNEVIVKLKSYLSDDEVKRVYKVYGPRRTRA
jgi:hypothetical protein